MNVSVSTLLAEKKDSAVFSIPSTATALEAVQEMNRHRVGSVVVLDGHRLVGIFTERDVLHRVVAQDVSPKDTPVSSLMTTAVETVSPETSIDDAMNLISTKRHRHIPVVDGDALVGLISIGDITRWISNHNEAEARTLRDYITGGYSI